MNKSLTFESIYNELMTRYGGLDIENLAIQLKKDGLGGFVEMWEQNRDLFGQAAQELFGDLEESVGVMPTIDIRGIPLTAKDTFRFSQSACLQKCMGECCKHKNSTP